jgi:hypothetical protein
MALPVLCQSVPARQIWGDFQDLELIWHNAIKYNGATHGVGIAAADMRRKSQTYLVNAGFAAGGAPGKLHFLTWLAEYSALLSTHVMPGSSGYLVLLFICLEHVCKFERC